MGVKSSRILALIGGTLAWLSFAATAGAGSWVLTNGDRLTGELVADGPEFIEVLHPQLGRIRVPRAALQVTAAAEGEKARAVVPAPGTIIKVETAAWKRQLELGYAQQSGAKETQNLSVRVQLDGREGANTFRATSQLLQSEANGKTVNDRLEGDFRWRHEINKQLFAQALTTYAEDSVRKIDLSLEQQIGGGYRLVDTPRHKINFGLGAVVQYLQRESAPVRTALLGAFFQDYAYQWNNRLKLVQESSLLMSDSGTLNAKSGLAGAPAEGSYRVKFTTGVQSKVTDQMSLNVRFEFDYDRSILDSELRADQRLTTSLGYLW